MGHSKTPSPPSSPPKPPQPPEWRLVQPKKNRRPRKPPPAVVSSSTSSSSWTTRPAGPLRSLQDITSEYHRLRHDAPAQQCCTSIRLLIRANADACSRVENAICLGMGSFDPPDGAWEAKRRAYIQYLVFEAMIEEL
ncbi:hypothetical protein E4U54_004913, partial [Claviceps lovelessii]